MPTPNYAFAKRQRDLAKKAKKEEKLKRKAQGGADSTAPADADAPPHDLPPLPATEKSAP